MCDHPGDERASRVALDRVDVGGEVEIIRLSPLSHHVGDVDLLSSVLQNATANSVDEEARDHAGEETPRSEDQHVRGFDRLGDILGGLIDAGAHLQLLDRELRGGDLDLSRRLGAAGVPRDQGDLLFGRRKDLPPHAEESVQLAHRGVEAAGHPRQRGDHQVSEAVTLEVGLFESVVEKLGEDRLAVRECDEAVADVPRGDHVELFAESTGGTAVVGDCDHRSDRVDPTAQAGEET